jgi:hypothetical protein
MSALSVGVSINQLLYSDDDPWPGELFQALAYRALFGFDPLSP